MESLLPGLVKTARSLAMQNNPQNLSPEEEHELDEYLLNTTKGIFGGGGGAENPLAALMGSLGGAGAGGENPLAAMMSGLGGLGSAASGPSAKEVTHKGNIHETITVDLPDFFGNKEFSVKLHVKTFDPELNAVKKKKKRIVATLPAGSPEDFVLSIPGQGHYDSVTKTCGTVFIHFQMDPNSAWKKIYRRQGSKLTATVPMESFRSDGFLFCRTFPHPCGRNLEIVVDPDVLMHAPIGVGGREFITIPGMGMPRNTSIPGDNFLQIRVVMDLEKMEYVAGDFTLQARYAIADSMRAFGTSMFGESVTTITVTNPSWVHGRNSAAGASSHAAAGGAPAAVNVVEPTTTEEQEEEEQEEDDSSSTDEEEDGQASCALEDIDE
jgi:hypothetical protein